MEESSTRTSSTQPQHNTQPQIVGGRPSTVRLGSSRLDRDPTSFPQRVNVKPSEASSVVVCRLFPSSELLGVEVFQEVDGLS